MRIDVPSTAAGGMKEVVNDRQTTLEANFTAGHEYEVVVRAVGPDGTLEAMESAVGKGRNTA